MIRRSRFLAAATCLVAVPALAQNAEMPTSMLDEARIVAFVQGIAEDIRPAIESQDVAWIRQWTQDTIADTAVFMVSSEVYRDGERTVFTVANLDKQDLLELQTLALSSMTGQGGGALRDIAFEIDVVSVDPIGPNAAAVETRITESATLPAPTENAAASATTQDVDATGSVAGARFESTSTCHHIVQTTIEGDTLQIGMTTCQSELTMSQAQ